jgi:predicted GNAT family N-acyltransferase
MIEDDFIVEPASWQADREELCAVREQVFVIEQRVPRDEEVDASDPPSRHVLARDAQGRAIGAGRLTPARTIGRVAVLAEWRGRGVGAALVRVLLEQARALGYAEVDLHAQTHAIAFYQRLGFSAVGEPFDECGIPHRTMQLSLGPPAAREPAPLAARPEARVLIAEDREQTLAATALLLDGARNEIAIYTRDLDPALLDVPATLDAIRRIALSGRRAQVRILLQEPRRAVNEGHRLVALAQRLPSAIALRTPVDERDLQYPSAFLVTDARGYFFRPLASRLEGEGSTYAPGRHAQFTELFDRVWERSEPTPELRQLGV